MAVRIEDIKSTMDNQQQQLLYGFVRGTMAENKKAGDKEVQEKIKIFEDNIILLINLILSNNIPSNHITRFMVLLINKILSESEAALANITISNINQYIGEISRSMITLHKLCQEENFKDTICKIQAGFITDCIINTEAPARELRQQLQLWRIHLTNGASDPKYETAKTSIPGIEKKIEIIDGKTKQVEVFCEQYKVRPTKVENRKKP
jgi:hypothetical protein